MNAIQINALQQCAWDGVGGVGVGSECASKYTVGTFIQTLHLRCQLDLDLENGNPIFSQYSLT